MSYEFISTDNVYIFDWQSNKFSQIYDWHCDLINNKITTEINSSKLTQLNHILQNIKNEHESLVSSVYFSFFEHDKKIFIATFIYCYTQDHNRHIIYFINNKKYTIHNDTYRIKSKSVKIKNGIICVIDSKETSIISINNEQEKNINSIVLLEGKINDELYYEKRNATFLNLYSFRPNVELKSFDLSLYGQIHGICNLKERIYMIMKNNEQKYILIYDKKRILLFIND